MDPSDTLVPTLEIKRTARSIISVLDGLSDRSEGISVVMDLPTPQGKLSKLI